MNTPQWTPQRAANRLVKVTEQFASAHGFNRFPVDVPTLAMETARIFGWNDPISEVRQESIKGFEGALLPGDGRKKWMLLYSDVVKSAGRIRFTQAHELGHYILHRLLRNEFFCSDQDMLNWSQDERDIEGQADLFASYLLMPLDDYRKQITSAVDLDALGHCADRYGVSLTAAILKWLQYTDQKAVLIMSNDGFMKWAWSSEPAFEVGAYFKTRSQVISLPASSLAADDTVVHDRKGREMAARIWFPHAPVNLSLREMKIYATQYDAVLTLLHLPRGADVRQPWAERFPEQE